MEKTSEELMTFESAMQELQELVQRLESGNIPLADAMHAYERGTALRKFCETELEKAKMKVEQVTQITEDGQLYTQDFTTEETTKEAD